MTPIAPPILAHLADSAAQFQRARPFRHIVLDGFLEADFLRALVEQFPPFERGNALDEAGKPGAKAVVERIAELGPAYAQLDRTIQSREFLDVIGRITSIEALQYDPEYFGGGTHENRAGQELDPHVDFNRHPLTGAHRRLNLIVYLNPVWDAAWGGSLELHSDPRSGANEITRIEPLMNRCVIFETTEASWHGFTRIDFGTAPPQSRRSIALYFYTRDRPQAELADPHSTIYVERPLPARFQPGRTLDAADVADLHAMLGRRDQHLARLYRDVGSLTRELENTRTRLRTRTLPLIAHYVRRLLGR